MDPSQLQGFPALKAMSFIPIKIKFLSLLLNVLLPHLAIANGPTAAEQPRELGMYLSSGTSHEQLYL